MKQQTIPCCLIFLYYSFRTTLFYFFNNITCSGGKYRYFGILSFAVSWKFFFWHIHHKGGQILLVTGGRGWYQQWGKPAQALKPGDVVNIPAGVRHWHGATKDSWFSHLAVAVPAEGASNEWLEQVSDEEYQQLK